MSALRALPPTFAVTRDALHRVAEEVVAPARKPHNEIALRQTPGGFGTPEFEFEGAATQVRVETAELVLARGGDERRTRLESLAAAGRFLGAGLLPDGIPDDESPLELDEESARCLAEVYACGAQALMRFREGARATDNPSPINLWPEHFDMALEAGDDSRGRRANYGVSPGDEDHPEPYAYVGPWSAAVEGELWHARGFTGAELAYAELAASGDPVGTAVEFFEVRKDALDRT